MSNDIRMLRFLYVVVMKLQSLRNIICNFCKYAKNMLEGIMKTKQVSMSYSVSALSNFDTPVYTHFLIGKIDEETA